MVDAFPAAWAGFGRQGGAAPEAKAPHEQVDGRVPYPGTPLTNVGMQGVCMDRPYPPGTWDQCIGGLHGCDNLWAQEQVQQLHAQPQGGLPILSTSPKAYAAPQQFGHAAFAGPRGPDGYRSAADRRAPRGRQPNAQRQNPHRQRGQEDQARRQALAQPLQPGLQPPRPGWSTPANELSAVPSMVVVPPETEDPCRAEPAPAAATASPRPAAVGSGRKAARGGADARGLYNKLLIRNTFLAIPPERSPSLERFFQERQVKSSPPSGPNSGPPSAPTSLPASGPPSGRLEAAAPGAFCFDRMPPFFMQAAPEALDAKTELAAVAAAARLAEELGCIAPRHSRTDSTSSAGSTTAESFPQPPQLLELGHGCPGDIGSASSKSGGGLDGSAVQDHQGLAGSSSGSGSGSGLVPPSESVTLADASRTELTQPVLGSAELPSRGSGLHRWGACKPCAFVFQGGCMNDVNCEFCHLCEPGERKRRKKEWVAYKRELREETCRQQGPQGKESAAGWRVRRQHKTE